jgi:hypothetical protein
MINSRWLLVVLLAIVCISWGACTQERQPCLTPKKATLIAQSIHFASDTATIPVDSLLPHGEFTPITTVDSTPLFATAASLFGISLSPDNTVCQWKVSPDTTAASPVDTLTFYYRKNLKFISNACGYTYFYSIDSVRTTHAFIDSVHIQNPGVTNVTNNVKNVQIYIKRGF